MEIRSPGRTAQIARGIAPPTDGVLVVNTRSRLGAVTYAEARRLFKRLGIRLHGVYPIDRPERLPEVVATAVATGVPLVLVGGGDGTMASVARHLAYRDTVLGIIPFGTTNDLARRLGVPLVVEEACRLVLDGKVASVDVGEIGQAGFVNTAGVGFTGWVNRSVTVSSKRLLGRTAFALAGLREIMRLRPFRATITLNERRYELATSLVLIANGRPAGWDLREPDATVDNHFLTVYAPPDGKRSTLVRTIWRLAFRKSIRDLGYPTFVTQSVHIETDRRVDVDAEGELVGSTPVTARVLPNALRVVVPQNFVDR